MPQTIDVALLSGSTSGKLIKVTATASPGTTVHTTHATRLHALKLFVVNKDVDAEERTVTVEWGGTTADDQFTVRVPAGAMVPLVPPFDVVLTGSSVIRVFADEANDIYVFGSAQEIY